MSLDLTEVTIADRDVVRFLAVYELEGIELRNCPACLQGWMDSSKFDISNDSATKPHLG
ncbi:MAG: hypothetical protein WCA38_09635 [Candidatus Acidiferrales bacterium]